MGIWRRFVALLGESRPSLPSLDALSLSAQHSKQYRQGDLLFVSRPSAPPSGTVRPDGVIERGELTGHAHRLEGGAVYDLDSRMYLEVSPGGPRGP